MSGVLPRQINYPAVSFPRRNLQIPRQFEILITGFVGLLALAIGLWVFFHRKTPKVPISVNYHFSRKCNYECGFCLHTEKTSDVEPLESAKRGLAQLKNAGMRKINFAGGKPLLYPKHLGSLIKYCKEDLGVDSVSIVTNGSKLTSTFLTTYGQYINIIAVSCDSFREETNMLIGRGTGAHVGNVARISALCREHGIKFKLITVINRFNFDEDINASIAAIKPFRWKCFQVLVPHDENESEKRLREARKFLISDDEFNQFCRAHEHNKCFVPEPNNVMKTSYPIPDEYMRFLNKGVGAPTKSILEVGVQEALESAYWDEDNFHAREGIYDWERQDGAAACSQDKSKLEW
ncbi:hypothetical protein MW887_004683 [Aspergillus wentii]|nr:hypothetical protein MW887_004683 [Aspergillus wentii]